jgi:hypothetical protein
MLASVSEMLWRVTPKVLAQTPLSLPTVGAHPAPSLAWFCPGPGGETEAGRGGLTSCGSMGSLMSSVVI